MKESIFCPLRFVLPVVALLASGVFSDRSEAQSYTTAKLADGFDYPVGKPNGYGYYVYRGFTQYGHLGEDWNGTGGGNSDLGDSVYCIGNGVVIFSRDYKKGWGNVVIIRHAYRGKNGQISFVDSLYGHLRVRMCKVGEQVIRGQKIGTIGRGPYNMYAAHLHFEIRKDLRVGMRRDLYPKTYSTYHSPRYFLDAYRKLRYESRLVRVPIGTFQKSNPNRVYTKTIEPPRIDSATRPRPIVSETTNSIIDSQTEPANATPEKSKSVFDKLFGR